MKIERVPVPMALVVAGLWLRVAFGAAFAALSAPLLVAGESLRAGDGVALFVLGGAIAWIAWQRVHATLGDDARAPRERSATSRPASA
jgi:hypothetical protein